MPDPKMSAGDAAGAIVAPLRGWKAYIVGGVMVINMLYTLFTGEQLPTYDTPVPPGSGVEVVGGGIGAGFMAIRAAISKALNEITSTLNDIKNAVSPSE